MSEEHREGTHRGGAKSLIEGGFGMITQRISLLFVAFLYKFDKFL
jgi:hypothetical protein